MPTNDIAFKVTKGNGTIAATLKVKRFTSPGNKPAPWENVKLVNGNGTKPLRTATTYDLGYLGLADLTHFTSASSRAKNDICRLRPFFCTPSARPHDNEPNPSR